METGRTKSVYVVVIALVVLGGVAMGWWLTSNKLDPELLNHASQLNMEVKRNLQLPAVELTDLAGQPVQSSDWSKGVIILNFWAAWCSVCETEVPVLGELQARVKPLGIRVVAVSTDTEKGPAEKKAEKFRDKLQVALDPLGRLSHPLAVDDLPDTFIVKDGVILGRFMGANPWLSDGMLQFLTWLAKNE